MQNIFAKNIFDKACIISFSVLVLNHEHNEETLPPHRASNDAASGGRTYCLYN